ncbi:MAG: PEGA domain-containing protein [bacterium]|nr:PEGA domain-containing protein [Myxococcales bacterium]
MGTILMLVVALLAPAGSARIQIDVEPANATIQLDGKRVKPSKGVLSVSPGRHTVKASASGYTSKSETVTVKAGGAAKVTLRLAKSAKAKAPLAKGPAKRPAKRPVKRPVASGDGDKAPVAKAPIKRPVKKPVGPTSKPPVSRKPTVAKRPVGGGASPRPVAQPQPQPIRDDRDTGRTSYRGIAVVSFLVGGLATAGGIYLGLEANESATSFNDSVRRSEKQQLRDDVEWQSLGANILYGVGAVGILAGALLWAAEPDYRASVAPLDGGAYVGFEGRF